MERADRAQVGRSAVAGKRVESESRAFEQAARAAARMAAVRIAAVHERAGVAGIIWRWSDSAWPDGGR